MAIVQSMIRVPRMENKERGEVGERRVAREGIETGNTENGEQNVAKSSPARRQKRARVVARQIGREMDAIGIEREGGREIEIVGVEKQRGRGRGEEVTVTETKRERERGRDREKGREHDRGSERDRERESRKEKRDREERVELDEFGRVMQPGARRERERTPPR